MCLQLKSKNISTKSYLVEQTSHAVIYSIIMCIYIFLFKCMCNYLVTAKAGPNYRDTYIQNVGNKKLGKIEIPVRSKERKATKIKRQTPSRPSPPLHRKCQGPHFTVLYAIFWQDYYPKPLTSHKCIHKLTIAYNHNLLSISSIV